MHIPSPLRRAGLTLSLAGRALLTPTVFGVNAIAQDRQGRVILVRHGYMPGLHFPGGGVDSGEPPVDAILRELREEIGLTQSAPPEFMGLYTRRFGFVTNIVALYHVREVKFAFKPGWEIREVVRADPHDPPPDTRPGTRRRLAEYTGSAPVSPYW